MKHTSGEWTTEIKDKNQYEGALVFDSKGRLICDCNIMISPKEDIANAKLIAAAPDLLSALTEAPVLSQYNDAEKFIEAYEKWRDEIKLPAIKKATT